VDSGVAEEEGTGEAEEDTGEAAAEKVGGADSWLKTAAVPDAYA